MDKIFTILLSLLMATQVQALQIGGRGDSSSDWQKRGELADALVSDSLLVGSFSNNTLVLDLSSNTTAPVSGMMDRSRMFTRADVKTFGLPGRTFNQDAFDNIFSDWGLQLLHPGELNVGRLAGATDIYQLQLRGNTGDYVDELLQPMGFRTGQGYYIVQGDISRVADVPEPSILVLLGAGLLGIGVMRRKTRS